MCGARSGHAQETCFLPILLSLMEVTTFGQWHPKAAGGDTRSLGQWNLHHQWLQCQTAVDVLMYPITIDCRVPPLYVCYWLASTHKYVRIWLHLYATCILPKPVWTGTDWYSHSQCWEAVYCARYPNLRYKIRRGVLRNTHIYTIPKAT